MVSLAFSSREFGFLCLLTVFLSKSTKSHLTCSRKFSVFQPLNSETKSGILEDCNLKKPYLKEAITNHSNCFVVNKCNLNLGLSWNPHSVIIQLQNNNYCSNYYFSWNLIIMVIIRFYLIIIIVSSILIITVLIPSGKIYWVFLT